MSNVFNLNREILTDHSTAGRFYDPEGNLICDSLEDADRDLDPNGDWKSKKVFGETCIPYGLYEIKMQFSNHFQKMMPYLQNVVTHTGVMIHNGNYVSNTEGCILVGDRITDDVIKNSVVTFQTKVIPYLAEHLKGGEQVFIQITKSDKVIDKRNKLVV